MNCTPGLECLTTVDQIIVQQQVEILEGIFGTFSMHQETVYSIDVLIAAITGFETENKYTIKNSMGQKIFNATESSSCCSRIFCGPIRSFNMKLKDNSDNEIIHMTRPLECNSCFFPCCLQVRIYISC